jgi:hypothetical protein
MILRILKNKKTWLYESGLVFNMDMVLKSYKNLKSWDTKNYAQLSK